MSARGLLCYRPTALCAFLLPALSNTGWEVNIAHNPEEAIALTRERQLRVGLTPIDDMNAVSFNDDAFRPIISGTLSQPMEWVALIPASQIDVQPWRELIAEHFYDYHTLPPDLNRLLFSLGHAYGMASMMRSLVEHFDQSGELEEKEMVGASQVMQTLFQSIRKVASVDAPVLITGESGTGKELAACAVHERSRRTDKPFIAVNCGALPGTLIQSELFGHEKGAFTGAHERKIGYIEAANGGTLFLDEIGDFPHDLQINLLRFLQEGTIERIGGHESIHVDVRIIAATHVDLESAIREKRFRDDLYYRLNVLSLDMPPLTERGQDVEILARYFFRKFSSDATGYLKGFSPSAIRALANHSWPGNVRELINRIRRAMVMSDKRFITAEDLGLGAGGEAERSILTLEEARTQAEIEAILSTLRQTGNNISRAARSLGISRVTLYRLLDKYHIQV